MTSFSVPSWFPSDDAPVDDAAVYVYAIVAAPSSSALEVSGIEEQPVHWLEHDGFGVAASVVDPSDWTGDAGAEHLKDLAWVGPRAYRHEQVVEAVMEAHAAVYPARFGTLYSRPDRLRQALDARRDLLRDFLASVEGTAEWAVKGLLDREQAATRGDAPDDESGTAYLQRKKAQQEATAALDDWLDTVAETLFDPLAAQADDARVLSVPADAGRDREVAFNWAFLVPEARTDAFRTAVQTQSDRYADDGVTLDLTGPWPPYTFRPSLEEET
jgi:hypothetical protein